LSTGKTAVHSYATCIEKYFLPYFGDKVLEELTHTDVREFELWRDRQMTCKPKTSTLNNFTSAWNRVIATAVAGGYIDRGSQYCAGSFVKQIKRFKAVQSMSRKGNCWDNAVAESFFATLKKETIYGNTLTTRQALRAQVFEYIECDYNRTRRHSTIGWVSPIHFEHNYQQPSEVPVV
jgi:hypothetical protein